MEDVVRHSRSRIIGYAFLGVLFFLVIAHGGYFRSYAALGGIAFAVLVIVCVAGKRDATRLPLTSILMFAIGCLYVLSAVANGASRAMVTALAPWFMAACACFVAAACLDADERGFVDALCWLGIATAVLGFLMRFGIVPFDGGVVAGRLFFTFQYANSAGVWFAVVALLCASSDNRVIATAGIIPMAALALTGSMGAIALFIIAALVLLAIRVRADGFTLGNATFAIEFAGLLVVALALLFTAHGDAPLDYLLGLVDDKFMTFGDRFSQIGEAIALVMAHPLLGTGPDTWQLAPDLAPSANRIIALHCGYAQVALDAGLPALLLLVACLVLGIVCAVRGRDAAFAIVLAYISLHAMIDLDFHFAAILVLLAILLGNRDMPSLSKGARPAAIALAIVTITVCCVALAAQLSTTLLA